MRFKLSWQTFTLFQLDFTRMESFRSRPCQQRFVLSLGTTQAYCKALLLAAQVSTSSCSPSHAMQRGVRHCITGIMSLRCMLPRETCIYGNRACQTFPMSSVVEAADRRSMLNEVTSDIAKCSTQVVMADHFRASTNCIA